MDRICGEKNKENLVVVAYFTRLLYQIQKSPLLASEVTSAECDVRTLWVSPKRGTSQVRHQQFIQKNKRHFYNGLLNVKKKSKQNKNFKKVEKTKQKLDRTDSLIDLTSALCAGPTSVGPQ